VALRPAKLLESLPERRVPGLCVRVALGIAHQHADAPHTLGLRARRERPREHRAAKRDYEFSPPDVDCHVTLYGGHAHAVADDSMLWTPGLRLLQAWRVQQVSIETSAIQARLLGAREIAGQDHHPRRARSLRHERGDTGEVRRDVATDPLTAIRHFG
jgi:hypothetical protein